MGAIKIVIVDDHQIVRDGINALLIGVDDIEVTGEAGSSEELFKILKSNVPDIIILDITLPTLSGVEITEILTKEHPRVRVIIFSGYADDDVIVKVFEAGAVGILPKNTSRQDLLNAIYTVFKGEQYLNERVSDTLLKSYIKKAKEGNNTGLNKKEKLTERETEIVRLFAEGKSYKEIAAMLHISARTVESHKNNIMNKLDLKTTVDMVKYALKNNIAEL